MSDFSYRPGQREAIATIQEAWESGFETVILDAPVGSGKSLISAHLAQRVYEAHGWVGYFTSPLVSLVNQVEHDQLVGPSIATVTGRRNYPCNWLEDGELKPSRWPKADWRFPPPFRADDAPCVVGTRCPTCQGFGYAGGRRCSKKMPAKKVKASCPAYQTGACEYYHRKFAAILAPFSGTTLTYLLAVTKGLSDDDSDDPDVRFTKRDFLFIDEAHGLERVGVNELAFDLGPRTVDGHGWEYPFWESEVKPRFEALSNLEREDVMALLEKARVPVEEYRAELKELVEEDDGDLQNYRRHQRIKSVSEKLSGALSAGDKEEWILIPKVPSSGSKQREHIEVGPVTSRGFLERHLWPLAPRRVLSSGTFGDLNEYLTEVGLPLDAVKVVKVPSYFPPQNGPIFLENTARMRHGDEGREATKLVLARLKEIMDKEPDRGIIHVNSYHLAMVVHQHFRNTYIAGRLVGHGAEDRTHSLQRWLDSEIPGLVFVAVAMTDGLDLHDELARWQVILKAPFPSMVDPRVIRRLRMEDGQSWYRNVTARQLWQATGRIVRSATDLGRTYVLDAAAGQLMLSTAPDWGLQRISAGRAQTPRRTRPWEVEA
jgi:Rad3-related DNA helicase